MAVVTEHVCVNRIDFGYLNVECFSRFCDYKVNSADSDLSLANHICDLMHRFVKALAESICEVIDECLTAAVFGIFNRILSCKFRYIVQECSTCTVVCYKYSFNLDIFKISGKLRNVVKEARRLDYNCLSALFNYENLIVYKVVCLVRMELYISEVVYAYLALCECCLCVSILVDVKILLEFCIACLLFCGRFSAVSLSLPLSYHNR